MFLLDTKITEIQKTLGGFSPFVQALVESYPVPVVVGGSRDPVELRCMQNGDNTVIKNITEYCSCFNESNGFKFAFKKNNGFNSQ